MVRAKRLLSSRSSLHRTDEAVEQVERVVRAGSGFRVVLHAESPGVGGLEAFARAVVQVQVGALRDAGDGRHVDRKAVILDRKSTRLNSSHVEISYAVFCLKKKKRKHSTCQTQQQHT